MLKGPDDALIALSGLGGLRAKQKADGLAEAIMAVLDNVDHTHVEDTPPKADPRVAELEAEVAELQRALEQAEGESDVDDGLEDADLATALDMILSDEVTNVKRAKEIAAMALGVDQDDPDEDEAA
jgi:hypothetical protein